ncbi:hypothetical protein QAD02_005574 [Eretmocerus hayati]|uniref:Uncharacterized protein n=1 Tax=Eretmocerus hayati TaxID=131215 RepID=A0ACC2NT95_9HYME|nr:hypothetical protein QAD02_005574 [Eretmocerus hayati]
MEDLDLEEDDYRECPSEPSDDDRIAELVEEKPPIVHQFDDLLIEDDEEGEEGEDGIRVIRRDLQKQKLKRVRRKLGLIWLNWPEKGVGRTISDANDGYSSISDIEKVLLWYAENFRRQYVRLYPKRKPLLLTCANECGVQKFVSSSVRRSLLSYPDLTTWQGCAKFVSDFVKYEPPGEIITLPEHLHSPTHLLSHQRGNSFEMSTLLVCLLLGLGYNAYVVSGYASREVSLCDLTMISCPYLDETVSPEPPPPKIDESKYRPRSPLNFDSKYLEGVEAKKRRKKEEEMRQREEERRKIIMELERPPPDPRFGQRVHSWVLILPGGSRPTASSDDGSHVTEPLFVEATTGNSLSPRDSVSEKLYLGIESIWNHENYWVNMQDCGNACMELEWNLSDVKAWEHLLPGEPERLRLNQEDEDDEDEETKTRRNFHMVVPASYVDKLEVPFQNYERRYPNGHKTIFYKKTKVKLFGPYVRSDGMVQSITKYDDYGYNMPLVVYEKFLNRNDHLEGSVKRFDKHLVIDYYATGRPDFCRAHEYSMHDHGKADEERTLDYNPIKRLDNLYRIKMHPLYVVQEYENREDGLMSRFAEYSPFIEDNNMEDIHNRTILKIVEKFHLIEQVSSGKNIATREFDFVDNEIRLTYHYSGGQYTQATRSYIKPPISERGDKLVFTSEMTQSYNPDPLAPPDNFDDLIVDLEKQLIDEEVSVSQIRKAETEVDEFITIRKKEFASPQLNVSLFDPIRNQDSVKGYVAEEEKKKAQMQREVEGDIDVLSPYLARLGNLKYLTINQASQIKNDCLNDFKNTMVNRANDMMSYFKSCSDELEKMQTKMTHEDLSREEKEKLMVDIEEMDLKLRSLEVRLERHRELTPIRYRKLVGVLKQDRRLSILMDR